MRKMYAIYDVVAETCFPQVLLFAADGAAVRFFEDVCKDVSTDVGKHPGDYQLVAIGELSDNGVVIPAYGGVVVVATGLQWMSNRGPALEASN